MTRRRSPVAVVAALLAATAAAPAAAQPEVLVPGVRVRVSAPKHHARALTGSLVRVENDSIWIRALRQGSAWRLGERDASAATGGAAAPDTLWVAPVDALTRLDVSRGRRSRLAGMAWGAGKGILYAGGVGAVVGTVIPDDNEFLYESPAGGAVFWGIFLGTLGGGVGALYGLASPGERWQRVRVPSRQP